MKRFNEYNNDNLKQQLFTQPEIDKMGLVPKGVKGDDDLINDPPHTIEDLNARMTDNGYKVIGGGRMATALYGKEGGRYVVRVSDNVQGDGWIYWMVTIRKRKLINNPHVPTVHFTKFMNHGSHGQTGYSVMDFMNFNRADVLKAFRVYEIAELLKKDLKPGSENFDYLNNAPKDFLEMATQKFMNYTYLGEIWDSEFINQGRLYINHLIKIYPQFKPAINGVGETMKWRNKGSDFQWFNLAASPDGKPILADPAI